MTAEKIAAPERATPEDVREGAKALRENAESFGEGYFGREAQKPLLAIASRLEALADSLSSPTPGIEEIREAVDFLVKRVFWEGRSIEPRRPETDNPRIEEPKASLLSLIERRVQQGCQPKKIEWKSGAVRGDNYGSVGGVKLFFIMAPLHGKAYHLVFLGEVVASAPFIGELKRVAESKLRDFIQSITETESAGTVPQAETPGADSGEARCKTVRPPNPAAPSSGTRTEVEAKTNCERLLSVVNGDWTPYTGRIKGYAFSPKEGEPATTIDIPTTDFELLRHDIHVLLAARERLLKMYPKVTQDDVRRLRVIEKRLLVDIRDAAFFRDLASRIESTLTASTGGERK